MKAQKRCPLLDSDKKGEVWLTIYEGDDAKAMLERKLPFDSRSPKHMYRVVSS
jgi:hypothetical protein